MANPSVPSPGKWISDIFGKHIFRLFLGILEPGIPTFLDPRRAGGGGRAAGGGALRVGCGRSARRVFRLYWRPFLPGKVFFVNLGKNRG